MMKAAAAASEAQAKLNEAAGGEESKNEWLHKQIWCVLNLISNY